MDPKANISMNSFSGLISSSVETNNPTNMQTQANASQSILTDGNSLYTSLSYPDSLEKPHNQITTVNPQINFTCNQMSYPQFSTIIQNMEIENIPTGICALEMTNFSHQSLPFDASTRYWVPQTGNSVLNELIMADNVVLNSNNYPGSSRSCQELSLSLATCQPPMGQSSEMSSWGITSYSSLHKRPPGSEDTARSSNRMSFSSYKPVQISSLLHGSRFFHAMQEILAEIACYVLEDIDPSEYSANVAASARSPTVDFPNGLQEHEVEAKKKHLLSLLQVVDEQYNQCMDEIHTVISAFHAVTELDPSLHARFALPKVSLMYKTLRDRISSQILAMGAHFNEGGEAREGSSIETSFIQKQWALHQLKKREHQLWRPQRGLPEKSVSILRAWMFQNFLHPYPKDAEKHLLALKSGLTRSQVSNWFINARVRLWKPLIEEMYAEVNRRKLSRNEEEVDGGARRNHMRCDGRRFTVD